MDREKFIGVVAQLAGDGGLSPEVRNDVLSALSRAISRRHDQDGLGKYYLGGGYRWLAGHRNTFGAF